VSVIDDDAQWRQMLQTLLNASPGFRCASVHPNAEHALRYLHQFSPDVALVDIGLPQRSGIECVDALRMVLPNLQLMMLTVHDDANRLFGALQAGAQGYLLKSTPVAQILDSITQLHSGGSPMSPEIARKVVNSYHQTKHCNSALPSLTTREMEVVHEISTGARVKDVACTLNISEATVQSHIRHIYEKLNVCSRAGLFATCRSTARQIAPGSKGGP